MIVTGPAYAALLATLHAAAFPVAERWDAPAMAALLDMPGCFACLPPGSDTVACGMALVRLAADESELLSVAVLPQCRRRGIGRALLDLAAREASGRGARRMYLEVSVANAAARGLYQACAFVGVGRRRRYYPDGSDAEVMAAELPFTACGSPPA